MVKAKETNLEGVLEGKRQYQVPLFQRPYSWGKKQIDQLWSDLIEIADVRRHDPTATHFIGSLVLAASPDSGAVGVQKYLVVDGQQRLTTLTLLLAALRDHQAEFDGPGHRERIDTLFLVNRFERDEPVKVLPTQRDRDAYLAVIRATAQAGGDDPVGNAYRSFRAKIVAIDDPEDPHDLDAVENAVLRGLAVVAVTAEKGDNAHRIFESLNNTGLQLTQADLLKNYLFMRLGSRSDAVYHAVWVPLERLLDSDGLELLFWLDLVLTDERATQSEVYLGQQRRLEKLTTQEQIEAEIYRIARLGELLATILKPSREKNPDVRTRLERIRAWGSTTSYPVVMHVLAQRADGRTTDDQVVRALIYLESYFVRRIVIGRATTGLNRSLLQAVQAISDAPEVDVALRSYLSTGRKHFATDAQVREAVGSVPFYWQGRGIQKKLILQWLEESYGLKERVDPRSLTIEHVLPQSLIQEVRDDLEDQLPNGVDVAQEHERVVHTLGNLTITGYNSELSNRAFAQKREMLAKSGIHMNQAIAEHEQWGPAEIQARGAQMAERIIQLWPGPDEALLDSGNNGSELRTTLATILAEIPAGRWTSYSEVALVAGSHAVAVGTALSNHKLPYPWRVLQASGKIAPLFRWLDPGRRDDPVELLTSEGVHFDDSGRASEEQFIGAAELAVFAGLEVDAATLEKRRPSGPRRIDQQQREFWKLVRSAGEQTAPHVSSWRTPRPQHWYSIAVGRYGVEVELTVNSQQKHVGVEFFIADDKMLFHQLLEHRAEIEAQLGLDLEWREMPDRKASRIIVLRPGDFRDQAQVPELVEWLVSNADAFAKVFPQYL